MRQKLTMCAWHCVCNFANRLCIVCIRRSTVITQWLISVTESSIGCWLITMVGHSDVHGVATTNVQSSVVSYRYSDNWPSAAPVLDFCLWYCCAISCHSLDIRCSSHSRVDQTNDTRLDYKIRIEVLLDIDLVLVFFVTCLLSHRWFASDPLLQSLASPAMGHWG